MGEQSELGELVLSSMSSFFRATFWGSILIFLMAFGARREGPQNTRHSLAVPVPNKPLMLISSTVNFWQAHPYGGWGSGGN
jgi:hypothetical protein